MKNEIDQPSLLKSATLHLLPGLLAGVCYFSVTPIEPTFFLQQFYDSDGNKIQKGFQLYLQFIAGYRFEFFKKRLFIEPAIALKYWPVNTNFPASFAAIEGGAPKYKFEPGLNFGFRF